MAFNFGQQPAFGARGAAASGPPTVTPPIGSGAVAARWRCLRAPHLRPPQRMRSRTNKHAPQYSASMSRDPQRCSAACFPARGRQGEKVRELFTMCCTAGLGAKEVRREGSGDGGRKVIRRVRVLHRLMAAHSCAPGKERISLQLSNAGGRATAQPAI